MRRYKRKTADQQDKSLKRGLQIRKNNLSRMRQKKIHKAGICASFFICKLFENSSKKRAETPEKFSGAFALFYSCNVDKMCALQCSPDPIPNPVAGYPLLDLRDLLFRIGFGSFCHSGENQLVAVVAVI